MENKLQPEKFQLIKAVSLMKTSWLRFVDKSVDGGGVASFNYLKRLVEADQEDFIETLEILFMEIKAKLKNMQSIAVVNKQRYAIETFRLMWGRMCLIAYFFYHDEPFWKEIGFPEMFAKENNQTVKDDLNYAIKNVNAYFERQAKASAFKTMEQRIMDGVPNPEDFGVNPFRIAEGSKVDAMKIFNYMFDLDMFCQPDGAPIKRQKKQFMEALGKHFNTDFKNYAQAINRAAQEEHFMDIFHSLTDSAQKKYSEGID